MGILIRHNHGHSCTTTIIESCIYPQTQIKFLFGQWHVTYRQSSISTSWNLTNSNKWIESIDYNSSEEGFSTKVDAETALKLNSVANIPTRTLNQKVNLVITTFTILCIILILSAIVFLCILG